VVDTSPNEVWKASVNPAWAAAMKTTPQSIQFYIDPVTFLVQPEEPSIPLLRGLELNRLSGKFIVG